MKMAHCIDILTKFCHAALNYIQVLLSSIVCKQKNRHFQHFFRIFHTHLVCHENTNTQVQNGTVLAVLSIQLHLFYCTSHYHDKDTRQLFKYAKILLLSLYTYIALRLKKGDLKQNLFPRIH